MKHRVSFRRRLYIHMHDRLFDDRVDSVYCVLLLLLLLKESLCLRRDGPGTKSRSRSLLDASFPIVDCRLLELSGFSNEYCEEFLELVPLSR